MFTFSSARCKGCNYTFCCTTHRRAHQKHCKKFDDLTLSIANSEHRSSSDHRGTSVASCLVRHKMLKRKLWQPANICPHSPQAPKPLSQRKFRVAIRGKFRATQKVPTLESIKEEEEGCDNQHSATIVRFNESPVIHLNNETSVKTQIAKPIESVLKNSDAYKDFVRGTLEDSPIEAIKGNELVVGSLREKCDSTSTPNPVKDIEPPADVLQPVATPSGSGLRTQVPSKHVRLPPWLTPHLVENFKTSTPRDLDETLRGSEGGPSNLQLTDESQRLTAVVSPLATPVDHLAKRTFEMMRESSTPFYSARSCFSVRLTPGNVVSKQREECSPLTSHDFSSSVGPEKRESGGLILDSVRNFFRKLIRRMPDDVQKAPEGIDSPMRKRMRVLAESRLQCRPTYRGRYQHSPSQLK